MRLTFVISSLSLGGAERVVATMANEWARKGWLITVLTFDDGSSPPFYRLAESVRHEALDIAARSATFLQSLRHNLRRVKTLRRAIIASGAERVISFMDSTNVLTILAARRLGIPVIVAERSDPAMCPLNRPWAILRNACYPRAAAVVVQTAAARAFFNVNIRGVTHVIPNPVRHPGCPRSARQRARLCHVVALGRLQQEKGFDLLLRAFAKAGRDHPHWTLTIWGEGRERASLEALCLELGLADRVCLPGRADEHVASKLREADLFVLSSRYEGFPNALCEAMACGLAVISFDCRSGPGEIIRHGVDGLLVPPGDVDALASQMTRLMGNPEERERLAARAPEILTRFGVERVMGQWEKLLEDASSAHSALRRK